MTLDTTTPFSVPNPEAHLAVALKYAVSRASDLLPFVKPSATVAARFSQPSNATVAKLTGIVGHLTEHIATLEARIRRYEPTPEDLNAAARSYLKAGASVFIRGDELIVVAQTRAARRELFQIEHEPENVKAVFFYRDEPGLSGVLERADEVRS